MRRILRKLAILAVSTVSVAAMLGVPVSAHADPPPVAPTLARDGWTAWADSEQSSTFRAENVLDGDPATLWHTQYTPTAAPLPHSIGIDTWNESLAISGLRYRPRNDGSHNGNITRYEVYTQVADEPERLVASGTFADDFTEKTVLFAPVHSRFVRLVALADSGNRGYSSAAELNLMGYDFRTLPRAGWTVTADTQQAGSPATNAIDDDLATVWRTGTGPLPHTFTVDLHTSRSVSGFRYLPGTEPGDGRIGSYQLQVSDDGSTWGNPVAIGTLADDVGEKTGFFAPTSARFVRITALSEAGNHGTAIAVAELDLIGYGYPDVTLPRTGWTVSADSQEQSGGLATNAIDGNPSTAWHTQFTPTITPLPHTFTIDMHATNTVSGLRYRPRNDGSRNGNIGQYQFHVSTDGSSWGSPVAAGTFVDDATEKTVLFTPANVRYVRLTALTEAGNRGQWSSAAELNLTDNFLETLQCAASAPIYTTRTTGAFVQYQHLAPATGANSWGAQKQLATGFAADGRRVVGPDGVVYSAINNGELRRRRWNGTGWDTFAGGAVYEVIDHNPVWALFSTAGDFNKITVDARGDIYTLEHDPDSGLDNLHWRRYDPASHTLAHRNLGVFSLGFDLIVAAGPGVIYARIPDFFHLTGTMTRIEYDDVSQRWKWINVGGDWRAFKRMFSPGGDVLYGVRADNGDLMAFRYNPATNTFANGIVSKQPIGLKIGTGWQNDYETSAAPDSCRLTAARSPVRPEVTAWPQAPVTLAVSGNGHLHYSYVDEDGRAVYAEATDLTGGTPIRLAAVPGMTGITGTTGMAENLDGRMQLVGTGTDAEIHSNTKATPGGSWGTATSLGGFVTRSTALVRLADDRLTALSLSQRDGLIWTREQWDPNSGMDSLSCNADRVSPRIDGSSLTVLPTQDNFMRIVGVDRAGTVQVRSDYEVFPDFDCRHAYYQEATWQSLGGTGFRGPVSAILLADNKLQVFATGSDGVVHTQRETASGFPGTWTAVAGGLTASGAPSAAKAPDGMIKIVARSTDGLIHHTSETAAGSATFGAWQEVPDTDESATDPTVLGVPAANTWVVAYRTDLDVPKLRRYVPGALVAASGPFAEVPLTPPV